MDSARELAGSGTGVDQSVVPEVLMIVVSPESRIRRIEILKFSEPPEYRAPESWLAQFEDALLTGSLNLERSIVNITGATLTSQAVTEAARRVLALHRVIRPFAAHGGAGDR
ncbi:MAG: FMN-binding protein [Planctomycetota bacterium]